MVAAPARPPRAGGGPLNLYDDDGNGRITCAEARSHGIAPVTRQHPAYAYMRDSDGDGLSAVDPAVLSVLQAAAPVLLAVVVLLLMYAALVGVLRLLAAAGRRLLPRRWWSLTRRLWDGWWW